MHFSGSSPAHTFAHAHTHKHKYKHTHPVPSPSPSSPQALREDDRPKQLTGAGMSVFGKLWCGWVTLPSTLTTPCYLVECHYLITK